MFKGFNDVQMRFWVDLGRSGHIVRREVYGSGECLGSRTDIKLDAFKIGAKDVWMPVGGTTTTYEVVEDVRLIYSKEVSWTGLIYAVGGSMVFNKHPGPEAFKVDYKLGTPISDKLRQMQTEFGRQKIDLRPSKADAKAMLESQVAQAENQKAELVAADPSSRDDWSHWLIWGLGGLTLAAVVGLFVQRRGR